MPAFSGPLVINPLPDDAYREVSVDPTGRTGRFRHIQDAIDYVRPRASVSNPYTIRLHQGIYAQDVSIDASNLTDVNFVGSGRYSTVIAATKSWLLSKLYANLGITLPASLFNIGGSGRLTFQDMTIHGYFGNDGTLSNVGVNSSLTGIATTNPVGNLRFADCDIYGTEYAAATIASGTTWRWDFYNCGLFAYVTPILEAGSVKWHLFGCDLRGTRTNDTISNQAYTSGLQPLGPGEFQLWGCHIHGEDSRTDSGALINGANPNISAVRQPNIAQNLQLNSCVLHVDIINDNSSANASAVFAAIECAQAPGALSSIIATGCDIFYETPAGLTAGIVANVHMPAQLSNANTVVRLINCSLRDSGGSGGTVRADFYRQGGAVYNGTPVLEVSGTRWKGPMQLNSTAAVTWEGNAANKPNGNGTLASGTKTVLLITDAGNIGGAADASFTNGSTTFTVVDSSIYREGQFVKAASHADTAWTRIKRISNATTIVLDEGYRGATLATTQGRSGVPTKDTQLNATYQVMVTFTSTPTASDKLSVGTKHPSGFVVTSADAASTSTFDWTLER